MVLNNIPNLKLKYSNYIKLYKFNENLHFLFIRAIQIKRSRGNERLYSFIIKLLYKAKKNS